MEDPEKGVSSTRRTFKVSHSPGLPPSADFKRTGEKQRESLAILHAVTRLHHERTTNQKDPVLFPALTMSDGFALRRRGKCHDDEEDCGATDKPYRACCPKSSFCPRQWNVDV